MSRTVVVLLAAVVLLAGCTNFNRIVSYGSGWADGIYTVGGKRFEVWMHPTDNTVLLNGSIGNALGQGAIQGVTLGVAETSPAYKLWMQGAKWLLDPVGCQVKDLRPLNQDVSWEFDVVCPPGVDFRQLMLDQRASLREGKALDLSR